MSVAFGSVVTQTISVSWLYLFPMAVPIAGNVIMGADGEGVVRFRQGAQASTDL